MPAQEAPLPRVQNFKVHKLLGKGSYGKVYKVQRNSDGQFYALKETDLGGMSQVERMDAVNEIRLLVSISHASVIRYHEAFLNGNKLCVVMEYAPFGDLKYYINKGLRLHAPFPEEAIWRIFLQLCQGLSALHANNIIHRDIKPANIFLCQNDVLKIGDLGVAKALNRIDFAKTQIGTPVYMAPEVWTGKLYSYSSDLWSLGCVLYEMMTFRVPIEGRTLPELKIKVNRGLYAPVPQGRYSPELINICHSLLTVDPRRRPSPDAILQSAAASKWLRVLPNPPSSRALRRSVSDGGAAAQPAMADTIVVPRDIRQLPKMLPPPSYDHDRDRDRAHNQPPPRGVSSNSADASAPTPGASSDAAAPRAPSAGRPDRPPSAGRGASSSDGAPARDQRPPSAGRARASYDGGANRPPVSAVGVPAALHGRPRSASRGVPASRAAGGMPVYGGIYGGRPSSGYAPGAGLPGLSGLARQKSAGDLLPNARPHRRPIGLA